MLCSLGEIRLLRRRCAPRANWRLRVPLTMPNTVAETEAVWRTFSKPLRAFVSRRVPNAQNVDDILQDVAGRIHRGLGSVRLKDNRSAWLFQITRNAIADHYRSKHDVEQPLAEDFDAAAPAERDDGEPSGLSELSACVAPMIAALPEKYRDALAMTDLNGLTQQEAAKRLGVSLSGMKSRVQRGRKQIKTMLLTCCNIELDRCGGIVDFAPRKNDCSYCNGAHGQN
jgi:RNA polymerase sigma-70 factor, ECF subfamily